MNDLGLRSPSPDSPASTSSIPTINDSDSLYDFVDVQVSNIPAPSDQDMNTNEHAKHRRELLDLMNRLRSMGYAHSIFILVSIKLMLNINCLG